MWPFCLFTPYTILAAFPVKYLNFFSWFILKTALKDKKILGTLFPFTGVTTWRRHAIGLRLLTQRPLCPRCQFWSAPSVPFLRYYLYRFSIYKRNCGLNIVSQTNKTIVRKSSLLLNFSVYWLYRNFIHKFYSHCISYRQLITIYLYT